MTDLIPSSKNHLAPANRLLQNVRAENLWLANYTSQATRDAYRRAVEDFIAHMDIRTAEDLYTVTQAHIVVYRDILRDGEYSNASIAARLSALSSLYKFLADQQLCKLNPVSGIKRPKSGHSGLGSGKTPALSREHVRQMLDAPDTHTLKGLRDRALLHVYFYTGGRCSEPAKLKVKDFRMDGDYWVLELTLKGDKTNTVAIHTECQIALSNYLEAAGHGSDPQHWLFQAVKKGRNTGQAISRVQFYRLFKQYAAKVGLPDYITPHSARATFITQGYEAGIPGEDIQRTVGHSSITTTEAYNRTATRHRQSASFAMKY